MKIQYAVFKMTFKTNRFLNFFLLFLLSLFFCCYFVVVYQIMTNCFSKWLHQFVCTRSALVNAHPHQHMICHCGFNVHFWDYWSRWASFIGCLNFLSIKLLRFFLIFFLVIFPLFVDCRNSLYFIFVLINPLPLLSIEN